MQRDVSVWLLCLKHAVYICREDGQKLDHANEDEREGNANAVMVVNKAWQ